MAEAAISGDPAEARGFEALSDANRREILRILSDGGKPVREIADAMTISRPAVSRHLRLLKDAGMVAEQAQGARRIYHLQERGIEAVREYLGALDDRLRDAEIRELSNVAPGRAWRMRTREPMAPDEQTPPPRSFSTSELKRRQPS